MVRRAFRVFRGMHVLVTLVAVLCHALAGAPGCIDEIVTDSALSGITLQGCQVQAQIGIAKWMSEHPVYRSGWRLDRYKCVLGPYTPQRHA